jgi:methionyl-tRNA synthetase
VPLTLPYDVPANQFMNLEGQKISGSRNWAVWGRDALTRYDPDALRYYLTVNMPEAKDSDWDWGRVCGAQQQRTGRHLGQPGQPRLSFCYKHWEGHVPDVDVSTLRPADLDLLAVIENGFESVGALLDGVQTARRPGRDDETGHRRQPVPGHNAPWKQVKEDKAEAAKTVYTALKAIDSLKVLFSPFLPFTSEKLHTFFGYETPLFGEVAV